MERQYQNRELYRRTTQIGRHEVIVLAERDEEDREAAIFRAEYADGIERDGGIFKSADISRELQVVLQLVIENYGVVPRGSGEEDRDDLIEDYVFKNIDFGNDNEGREDLQDLIRIVYNKELDWELNLDKYIKIIRRQERDKILETKLGYPTPEELEEDHFLTVKRFTFENCIFPEIRSRREVRYLYPTGIGVLDEEIIFSKVYRSLYSFTFLNCSFRGEACITLGFFLERFHNLSALFVKNCKKNGDYQDPDGVFVPLDEIDHAAIKVNHCQVEQLMAWHEVQ
ncbi:unnamed protein product [Moneuplotes crassus]|uniref:Uncharacterized protein n=1 Tax=Euplotes crassus TaxID=5936 RepID=A0AAD1XIS1_EUPCR|nr:unnamed protein product [Moneuplotes crassus]